MRPSILFWLLIACLAAWIYTLLRQRRSIRRLERSQEEIQVEETLVFDFLHGLGEAFSETIRPTDLHRLIVEGATRVLDAQGGALYLTDRTGTKLVPTFVSKGCPPLVDVPPHALQQTAGTPGALENFLRVHNIGNGEGVLGRVWQTATPLCLNEFSEAPELAKLRDSSLGATSVLVALLLYANQNLGVLALANRRSVLRSQAIGNPSPADVLQKVNRQLYPDIKEDMFISMAYLVLDHVRGGVTLARAGHDAPLLYQQKSQTLTPLKTPGMVVGIDSGDVFDRLTTDVAVPLERNDCILLYTDGITEALDNEGNEFGLERTIASVQSSAIEGAQTIVTRLIDDLRNFVGSTPQNDDITMIAIRKT